MTLTAPAGRNPDQAGCTWWIKCSGLGASRTYNAAFRHQVFDAQLHSVAFDHLPPVGLHPVDQARCHDALGFGVVSEASTFMMYSRSAKRTFKSVHQDVKLKLEGCWAGYGKISRCLRSLAR